MKRSPLKKGKGFAASPAQRKKVKGMGSIYSGRGPCDPAHVIPRSLLTEGQEDPLAVVPLTRGEHRLYDGNVLDLWRSMESFAPDELEFAIQRIGFERAKRIITGKRVL